MLNSKWDGTGKKEKKKDNEKVKHVKKAGDGIENRQNTLQKAQGRDTIAISVGGVAVAIGNTNVNVPLNVPIANDGTGGSINKESGSGSLRDNDEAEFLF